MDRLRQEIKHKYREVALTPEKGFHFHTGRPLAAMLSYDLGVVDALPARVVESFAGVNNPFCMGELRPGEIVVDVGSGAGFDSILAARLVSPGGRVIGVDMADGCRLPTSWSTSRFPGARSRTLTSGPGELPVRSSSRSTWRRCG